MVNKRSGFSNVAVGVAALLLLSPGARAEWMSVKDAGQIIAELTDVKRGATAHAEARDSDVAAGDPPIACVRGAGLLGTAECPKAPEPFTTKMDDSSATAHARNSLFGKTDPPQVSGIAGKNGAYVSTARITWKGKIVAGKVDQNGDPKLRNEITASINGSMRLLAESLAWYDLSIAYKIVERAGDTLPDTVDFALQDERDPSNGYQSLFRGRITVGDAGAPLFYGDFASSDLMSQFYVDVSDSTHKGSVVGPSSLDISALFPVFDPATQGILFAATQESFASAEYPGRASVQTVAEPSALWLAATALMGLQLRRRRPNQAAPTV